MGISIVGINLMKSWANSTIHRCRTNNMTKCNSLPLRTNRNSFSLLRKWPYSQSQLNLSSSYKSGTICICHVDLEKNHLNVLHKLLPDSTTTICCSIQFAHADSPLGQSEIPISPSIIWQWFSFSRSWDASLHQLWPWVYQSVRLHQWKNARTTDPDETIEKQ